MVEVKNIQNLLSQVNTISTSYEKIAQATGENFNIFSVLGIEHYETSTHSKFLAHLLNPKGQHGLGNKFLELLIDQIGAKEHLDTETTICKVEHFIGIKTFKDSDGIEANGNKMKSEGGLIDIYLWDNNGKSISIENKIYACDQEKQIVRYYNYNKGNNRVLYLTLDGKDASEYSKGTLISDIDKKSEEVDFYCISYDKTILKWLEKCQKEASDLPILRETIKQYKNLIKKLTHQNINSDMTKEITELILDNPKSTQSIIDTVNTIRNNIVQNLDQIVITGNNDLEKLNIKLKIVNEVYYVPQIKRFKYNSRDIVNFDLVLDDKKSSKIKNHFCFEFSNFDFGIKQKGWSENPNIKPLVLDAFSNEVSEIHPYSINENDVEPMLEKFYGLIIKIAEYLNENNDKY